MLFAASMSHIVLCLQQKWSKKYDDYVSCNGSN